MSRGSGMRVAIGLAASCALALVAGWGFGTAARVGTVIDGDTVGLHGGARVRLLQIDTPELGSGECYSRAAQTALRRLAPPGTTVRLDVDPRLDRVDRYGRLLRYLFKGARNVNLELVRQGAAAPYFYDGDRGRYATELMAAAKAAKAAKRGLWGACPRTALDPYHQVETGQSGPALRARYRAGSRYRLRPERARRRPLQVGSSASLFELRA